MEPRSHHAKEMDSRGHCAKPTKSWMMGGDVAQLAEYWTDKSRCLSDALVRQESTSMCAIACININICAHVKDPVVHVVDWAQNTN